MAQADGDGKVSGALLCFERFEEELRELAKTDPEKGGSACPRGA